MKKTTFTKALKFSESRKGGVNTRPGYPGYLLEHPAVPYGSVVVGRGSKRDMDRALGYSLTNYWVAYDPVTGCRIYGGARYTTRDRLVAELTYTLNRRPESLQEELRRAATINAKAMLSA